MVRPSRNVSALARSRALADAFAALTLAQQQAMVEEIRAALRAAAEPGHAPVRDTHKHYHVHGLGSGAPGLDSEGGHAHMHSHGKAPSSTRPPVPDNNHDHPADHNELEWPPGQEPDPDYARPPGASGRHGRHVRFERGGVTVMNRAQEAAVDAAFARAAETIRQVGRKG
jgi:hypothetical protein